MGLVELVGLIGVAVVIAAAVCALAVGIAVRRARRAPHRQGEPPDGG